MADSNQPSFPAACRLCPRDCGAGRSGGELGFCRSGDAPNVAAVCRHRGEEPVISGPLGVCNIFFSHCNLQCLFCQNYQISRNDTPPGRAFSSLEQVVEEVEKHLEQGVKTVGYVSPSHCLPQMKAIIRLLKERGRESVSVMNTNAYDRAEEIRRLEDVIDVYLPDFKYNLPGIARDYSGAEDYPQVARAALKEMFRQKGDRIRIGPGGYILSGLIVRHLVLPGEIENSLSCLRWIAAELSPSVHLSLMAQYRPTPAVASHPRLGRFLREDEYGQVVEEMEKLGFVNGWTQEMDSRESYLPDFQRAEVFKDG